MVEAFTFGDRVRLSHITAPVYLRWRTTREVPVGGVGPLGFQRLETEPCEGHLAVADTYRMGGEVGLPLPDPSPDPDGRCVVRRLRRFPADATGIVVGRTFRLEGDYDPGSGRHAEDPDPPGLAQSRRVLVYEVAVGGPWPDRTAWPARVVSAIPEDVTAEVG